MSGSFALVLGAGGTVGMAYHAGVLRAVEEAGGLAPADAELVIGTSAGSAVGAFLRSDWSTKDLWDFSQGNHPEQLGMDPEEVARRRREIFRPSWRNGGDLARRAVGSAYVAVRSVARLPAPPLPAGLRRAFPGGLFSMAMAEERMAEFLPATWPSRALWLCAVDITTGRRVVLGRDDVGGEVALHRAVLASCAIPGMYPPVRIGRHTLVDGGAYSTTNLDLAARHGCSLILCVAPMAYDPRQAPNLARQLVRRIPSRALHREVAFAREKGAEVLMLRPSRAELAVHGANLMRPEGTERVAVAAYEATARVLEDERARAFLDRVR